MADNQKAVIGADVDNRVTVTEGSSYTENNNTSIKVESGGTLNFKDKAAIEAEHEQFRKDFDNFYDKTPMGRAAKAAESAKQAIKDFDNGLHNLVNPKSKRFDNIPETPSQTDNQKSSGGISL